MAFLTPVRSEMHEFSIATTLVNTVIDFAQKDGTQRKVLEVHLRVGKLRGISIEQLTFSYGILTKGTLLNGSRLIVKETPAKAHCQKCNFKDTFQFADESYHFGIPALSCPRCGGPLELEGGDEIVIAKIRMRRPSR